MPILFKAICSQTFINLLLFNNLETEIFRRIKIKSKSKKDVIHILILPWISDYL
jgi:hypothetical protein